MPIKHYLGMGLIALLALLILASPGLAVKDADLVGMSRNVLAEPKTGDLDAMLKRRYLRVLVTYNKTNYFLDGAKTRGVTYDGMRAFEKYLNKKYRTGKKNKHLKFHIFFVPVSRDQLIPWLKQGKGDIAAASLSVTPQRLKGVDFGDSFYGKVQELVVSGPGAPAIKSLEDLSGQKVSVRKSSSYYQSLLEFNQKLKKAGKAPVKIRLADERLETEDILEMVNAGLNKITIADSYLANFWRQFFKDLKVHSNIPLKKNVKTAWAIRKNSPKLKAAIKGFVKNYKKGTKLGNIYFKRYFQSTKLVKNAYGEQAMRRFNQTIKFFKKYAGKYDFDWLMVTALAYQESKLDQSKRSPVGAIGVMQIMPATAAGHPVEIPNIEKLEPNIHAGVKYLRFLYDQYFKNDPKVDVFNKIMFTFASYNAGPARVEGLRKTAQKMGLNPNIWFRNVEVAAARKIGRETVQYVSNIFKYYLAYKQITEYEKQRSKKPAAGGKG